MDKSEKIATWGVESSSSAARVAAQADDAIARLKRVGEAVAKEVSELQQLAVDVRDTASDLKSASDKVCDIASTGDDEAAADAVKSAAEKLSMLGDTCIRLAKRSPESLDVLYDASAAIDDISSSLSAAGLSVPSAKSFGAE